MDLVDNGHRPLAELLQNFKASDLLNHFYMLPNAMTYDFYLSVKTTAYGDGS
jgi:hypothetical protein